MNAPITVPCDAGVTVNANARVVHLCPHVEERDDGSVQIEWRCRGATLELHALANYLATFEQVAISHEHLVHEIREHLEQQPGIKAVRVSARYTTAGIDTTITQPGRITMKKSTIAAVIAYAASIVAANLLVAEYGPAVTVVNAFLLIGMDLALRDHLHEAWGEHRLARMAALIAGTGLLSYLANPATGKIALASTVAFTVAALADWAVYSAVRRWPFLARSNASNVVGAAADSLIFPTIAFGGLMLPIVVGQFLAKVFGGAAWSLLIAGARTRRGVTA